MPRIEQSHQLSAFRILTGNSGCLVLIAGGTGEPEIVLNRESAHRTWEQVFDLHKGADDGFLSQAEAAPIPGLLGYPSAKIASNVGRAHRRTMSAP